MSINRRAGLKTKLSVLLFTMNLVVILAVGLISFQSKKEALREQVENNLTVISSELADKVDRFLAERLSDTEAIALHYSLFNLETTTSSQNTVLSQYLKIYPYYEHINIISLADMKMPSKEEISGAGFEIPWYFPAIYGDATSSDMYISQLTGKPTMSFAAPVKDKQGVVVSIVTTNLKVDMLWDIVDQVRKQNVKAGKTGYAFLVNNEGFIIAHPNKEKILRENISGGGNSELVAMVSRMKSGLSGTGSYTYEDVAKTAAYSPCLGYRDFKGHGWSIAVTAPLSELFESLGPLLNKYLMIFAISSIFALLVSTILANYIVRPISALKSGAAKIGAGGFSMRIETRRNDEIGDLASTFNKMAETLETRDRQIKDYTSTLTRINEELEENKVELEKANEVLTNTNEELRKLQKQKAEFMAMITHDIKSPLSTIITYAEIVMKGIITADGEELTKAMKSIHVSGYKILSLVDNFLASSAIEAGSLKVYPRPLDINQFVDMLHPLYAPQMEKKGITFTISKAPMLPRVMADKVQLDRVLSNILSNAIKFTPSHRSISITTGLDEHGVTVTVADTGKGISEEEMGELFTKYKRVGETGKYEGLGLGLFISKAIMEAHGGKITVKSSPGEGSAFTIHLPVEHSHNNGPER